jgi:hypothetical protein
MTETHPLDTLTVIRYAAKTRNGKAKVFTNPITFLAEAPAGGIVAERAGIDLLGAHTTLIDDFGLTAASADSGGGIWTMSIDGTGENGSILFDLENNWEPDTVLFSGLTGAFEIQDDMISLTGINGTGTIQILTNGVPRPPPPAVPCDSIDQFVARCVGGNTLLARVVIQNSSAYVGEQVVFLIDSVEYPTTLKLKGLNTIGKVTVAVQDTVAHTVSLIDPAGCFEPVTVICSAGRLDNNATGNITGLPDVTALERNYPNPFNAQTVIRFQLATDSSVRLRLYDILGREVAVLAQGDYPAGYHSVRWDGGSTPTGVYFYRIEARSLDPESAEHFVQTRSLMLVK